MRRGRETTAAASAGLVGRRLPRMVALALLVTAAGCVPEPAFDNDPLVGGRPLPRNGSPPPAASGAVAASGPAAGPMQLPPPSGPVSPAALATGSSPAADASALRLGPPQTNPGPAPGALASAPSAGGDGWHGTTASTGPLLRGPEPITDGAVKPIAVIAPPLAGPAPPLPSPAPPPPAVQGFSLAPAPPAVSDTYGQLQDQLAKRGVLYQQLTGPDEHGLWRFRCAVPLANGQPGDHAIETNVAGNGGLAAMHAAIDQIDQYQGQSH